MGNVEASIDPLGNRTIFLYDALNRQTEIRDAEGGITSSVYDNVGNREALVEPVGNRTTFLYDALHRETE